MAMIEKTGSLPELVKTRESRFRFSWFKFGMILAGSGLGLCITFLLMVSPRFENIVRFSDGLVPIGLMFLFGGLGIVMAHYLEKPKEK